MTTAIDIAAAQTAAPPQGEVLKLADGVELIGEFEGSGFREPPRLARRADGQVIQLTELLYVVAEACDGQRDAATVAAIVTERVGRPVSPENVNVIVGKKLRPAGVLALADGTTPELPKRAPLLALSCRKPLLSERIVNGIARCLTWLHHPIVMVPVLLVVALFDAWLFGLHGIAPGLRSAIYNPALLLAALGSVVVATAFHEFGHASACRYSGARPGVLGVGVYLVWPAFYCDVTDAYRLDRRGRLHTDLGGVYFNAIFAGLAGAVYFATGEEIALFAAFLQHVIMLQQLLPLLRFDGYYVLSDLTGVPDILSRIKPIFRSLVRGRKREPQVAELKSWVRVVVTAYLLVVVPLLLFMVVSTIIAAPRMAATAYDSAGLQLDRFRDASGPAEMGVGVFRMLALTMPLAGIAVSLGRTGRMAGRGIVNWSRSSAPRAAFAAVATAAVVGAAGYIWWPNGDYQPIRPGERGTVGEALASVPHVPGGRPSFTPAHEASLGPAQTSGAEERGHRPSGEDSGEDTRPSGENAGARGQGREEVPDEGWEEPSGDGEDPFETGADGTAPGAPSGGTDGTSATPSPTPSGNSGAQPTPAPSGSTSPGTAPTATATPNATATPIATSSPSASPVVPGVGAESTTPLPAPTASPSVSSTTPEAATPSASALPTP